MPSFLAKTFSPGECQALGVPVSEKLWAHSGFLKAVGFARKIFELVTERFSTGNEDSRWELDEILGTYLSGGGFFEIGLLIERIEE